MARVSFALIFLSLLLLCLKYHQYTYLSHRRLRHSQSLWRKKTTTTTDLKTLFIHHCRWLLKCVHEEIKHAWGWALIGNFKMNFALP
jgi:hypothetical protein